MSAGILYDKRNVEARLFGVDRGRSYSSAAYIFSPGEEANSFFFIKEGTLCLAKESDDGDLLILDYFYAGDVVGVEHFFSPQGSKRTLTLMTKTKATLLEVSYKKAAEQFEAGDKAVMPLIGKSLARQIEVASAKAHDLAFLDVKDRTISALNAIAKQPTALSHPDGTLVRITRSELAQNISATREMVGRVLKDMHENKELFVKGKTIVINGLFSSDRLNPKLVDKLLNPRQAALKIA